MKYGFFDRQFGDPTEQPHPLLQLAVLTLLEILVGIGVIMLLAVACAALWTFLSP